MHTTIAKYRKAQRMTLRELATKVGRSAARICEYEHGEEIPGSTLQKIALVLGIPTGDLFQEDATPQKEPAHAD